MWEVFLRIASVSLDDEDQENAPLGRTDKSRFSIVAVNSKPGVGKLLQVSVQPWPSQYTGFMCSFVRHQSRRYPPRPLIMKSGLSGKSISHPVKAYVAALASQNLQLVLHSFSRRERINLQLLRQVDT